jgi:hypothetical protein
MCLNCLTLKSRHLKVYGSNLIVEILLILNFTRILAQTLKTQQMCYNLCKNHQGIMVFHTFEQQ